MFQGICIDYRPGYCILTINRPETLNALSRELVSELNSCIQMLEQDERLRVVVITGAGRAFVAGADIKAMRDMEPEEARQFARLTTDAYAHIEASRLVYIAAINGYAFGGGLELALACDLRVASTKAKMGLPECGLGIIPGGGGTQRLPLLIGEARAKELIFTCGAIGADKALHYGLVSQLSEPTKLIETAAELAETIILQGSTAIQYAKTAIHVGRQMDLKEGIAYEGALFGLCFGTGQQREGMRAFLEKRKPNFQIRQRMAETGGQE